ncbi:DUF928 domain-containing protein [Pseudanabaena sp. UWO310]|uniref:DUF928 domain-containing protein n=1 Tax=Pseudanabaena sp. UWO310 TaxID=2480795 RepID=UPI00115AB201|nr:DUF928 domain-containing protein [Pseudanabaena sp. UWO310]TYQ28796.1 DUF928 domain-containing protein [Pseudanabaena sp. UWO310]
MRCKVSIPQSNYLTAVTNKLTFHTCLSSAFTILICSLSSLVVPSDFLRLDAIAQTWLLAQFNGSNYGLGLPKTASTGGGTRLFDSTTIKNGSFSHPSRGLPSVHSGGGKRPCNPNAIRDGNSPKPSETSPSSKLPFIILITPEDGAKTASPQPTLYWYLNDGNISEDPSEAKDSPNSAHKDDLNGQLTLFMDAPEPIAVFQIEMEMHGGLASFKLPQSASLKPDQPYKWQIVVEDRLCQKVTVSGWIMYNPNEETLKQSLNLALTDRDRAKIYARSGYWFEAIDGYARWLKFKPNDTPALREAGELLKAGLANNRNLDFESFSKQLEIDETSLPSNNP